jgi:dTDP-3,4-didehydro-2,6-dideoxy-alpha-D-glucose 3-reductase
MTSNVKLPDAPLGVAVWGVGPHARRHILPAIKACEATRLVGITTRSEAVGREVSTALDCHYWGNPDDMLADPSVDAVYVATPTGLHHEHGMRVLEADRHLWCEKSLATGPEGASALVAAGRVRGLAVFEAFMYRHHPQFERLVAFLADGQTGRVLSLNCRFGLPPLDNPGFRDTRALGGSALLDVGCYPISIALALLGPELDVAHASHLTPPTQDIDWSGHALLRSPHDGTAFLEWGYDRAYRNDLTVWCEHASFDVDRIFSKPRDLPTTIVQRDRTGRAHRVEVPAADAFATMLARFAAWSTDEVQREMQMVIAEGQARLIQAIGQHASAAR